MPDRRAVTTNQRERSIAEWAFKLHTLLYIISSLTLSLQSHRCRNIQLCFIINCCRLFHSFHPPRGSLNNAGPVSNSSSANPPTSPERRYARENEAGGGVSRNNDSTAPIGPSCNSSLGSDDHVDGDDTALLMTLAGVQRSRGGDVRSAGMKDRPRNSRLASTVDKLDLAVSEFSNRRSRQFQNQRNVAVTSPSGECDAICTAITRRATHGAMHLPPER